MTPSAAVATSTSPLWFATRATGLIALVLLTITVVLGITTSVRFATPKWPRFVTVSLHRNLSLLVLTFVGLHVLTTVTDPFASISVLSVVVPFTSSYRTIWLGFGAIAFDLLLALLVTSLLRTRIGPRVWRFVHWASYACWPVALVHGLGTGTDGGARWVLAVAAACALAVTAAGAWRLATGWPAHAALRTGLAAVAVLVALSTAAWAWAGPLRPGWARRAGTPVAILSRAATGSGVAASSGGAGVGGTRSIPTAFPAVPFQAQVSGTVASAAAGSERIVTISLAAGQQVRVTIELTGPPVDGGVEMRTSRVTLGTARDQARYAGHVTVLNGNVVQAVVAGAGKRLGLAVQVTLSGNSASGTLVVASVSASASGEGQ
jgi:hypothetical protein